MADSLRAKPRKETTAPEASERPTEPTEQLAETEKYNGPKVAGRGEVNDRREARKQMNKYNLWHAHRLQILLKWHRSGKTAKKKKQNERRKKSTTWVERKYTIEKSWSLRNQLKQQ